MGSLALVVVVASPVWAADSDNGGISDEYAAFFGLNMATNDAASDDDADTLDNLAESALWSDPFVADTDRDGFGDAVDSNPVSRAWIPWGEPLFTHTNEMLYTWPPWLVSAFKVGGDWQTNPLSWHVSSDDTNAAGLNIEVDRALLTNDLVMQIGFVDHSNASVFVDLYDTNELLVANNLFDNLLSGSGSGTNCTLRIPLASYSNAVGIRLRRSSGEVTVCDTLLYVDKDGDGFDADQERQLGTSDNEIDSDHASAASAPSGSIMGQLAASSIQSGAIHVVAALGLEPFTSNSFPNLPFLDRFETNTVHLGDVNGQNGWIGSPSNTVLVQTGVVWEGEQAIHYNTGVVPSKVTRLFAKVPGQFVWVDFYAMAKAVPIPQDMTNQAAAFMFDCQGRLVVQDGRRPPGQKWATLTNVPPVELESWVRLSIGMDFVSQRWLLCLNGIKVAEDLGFDIPTSELHEFTMEGGAGALDQFSVSTNIPAGFPLGMNMTP